MPSNSLSPRQAPTPLVAGRQRLRVHGTIARDIGRAIVSGTLKPGHVLDGEIEASTRRKVSRTAYREAMRILSAKGLVNSRPRHGTRVSDVTEWNLLDPDVLAWTFAGVPRPEVIHGIFELRSVVEPAAAALAAVRRNQAHLDQMRQALLDMDRYTLLTERGRDADRSFHAALLSATGNPYIVSLTNGVASAVTSLTEFKHRLAKVRRNAVPDHEKVYDAIAAKDPRGARNAMVNLIRLAILDMPRKQRPKPPPGTPVINVAELMAD